MALLDDSVLLGAPAAPLRRPSPALLISLACALAGLTVLAAHGFTHAGLGEATRTAWRFDCLVFFAVLVAEPLGRLVPRLAPLAAHAPDLVRGFCGGIAVYCAFIIMPDLLAPPDIGPAAGTTLFIVLTGTVTLVMAATTSPRLAAVVGAKARDALWGVSAIYFWLCYALIGLAHISGPHRPDAFYETSILLMVAGLLARFAGHFFAARRAGAV